MEAKEEVADCPPRIRHSIKRPQGMEKGKGFGATTKERGWRGCHLISQGSLWVEAEVAMEGFGCRPMMRPLGGLRGDRAGLPAPNLEARWGPPPPPRLGCLQQNWEGCRLQRWRRDCDMGYIGEVT